MTRWLLLGIVVLLAACNSGRLPEGVLPPDRMAPLIKEMIAADEWVNWRKEQNPALDADPERIRRYRAALRAAKVDEQQFRTSFTYYEAHPKLLSNVFDSLQRQPNLDTVSAPMGKPRKLRRPASGGPVD